MDSKQLLSDMIVYAKYARHNQGLKRRENWYELVQRNADMHARKYPQIADEIYEVYARSVLTKKVVPSMRSLQFGGRAIEVSPNRMYNCTSRKIDSVKAFAETMFLLLGGSGVGISVQKHHVACIPSIKKPLNKRRRFVVPDTIMGWADAIKALLKSYITGGSTIDFDYSEIRPKGTRLVTAGGMAPGPEPLIDCINAIRHMLDEILEDRGNDSKMKPIEAHDICCLIANSVLAGGIRRSALISMFSHDDTEMLTCKGNFSVEVVNSNKLPNGMNDVTVKYKGRNRQVILSDWDMTNISNGLPWYHLEEHRGRANNSVMLLRGEISEEYFRDLMKTVENSKAGEPGVYWTNDLELGTNPCCLSGDSSLLTSEGYKKVEDLADGTTKKLINVNGDVVDGIVYATGIKEVFEIKAGNTKDPYTLLLTGDHIVMLNDGRECKVSDLSGKRIMPYFLEKQIDITSDDLRYGFVLGDGSFRRDSNGFKNIQCSFTPSKDDEVAELFSKTGWSTDVTSYTVDVSFEELNNRGINTKLRTYERELPDVITEDLMTGLFSANGCVIKSAQRVALKTASKEIATGVKAYLGSIGIGSYITTNKSKPVEWYNGTYVSRESYDVNISSLRDLLVFSEKINFIQGYKRDLLNEVIKMKSPYVYSVTSIGNKNVYDFSLFDDTHWGVSDGVVVHNCEISMDLNGGVCNLSEVNVGDIESEEDLHQRVKDATFIGTLQAGYTDFHYLGDQWREIQERDALLGVSMTGIGSGKVLKYDLAKAGAVAKEENERVAGLIGIKPAKRIGTVKPSGTASLVLGTSSGIHAWHNDYYVRRFRVNKDEPLYSYALEKLGKDFVEDDVFSPNTTGVIAIPVKAPDGSILRNESMEDILERVKKFQLEWIRGSHRDGKNTHNVSVTVSVKPGEWGKLTDWMWENRDFYNGISVLDYDGGTYLQMPFTDCPKEEYESMVEKLNDRAKNFKIEEIVEEDDNTDLAGEAACSGGNCEVK